MSHHRTISRFQRWLQGVDYGLLLPLMARLPLSWAYALSELRGYWHARQGRDWAEMALGFTYIAERTAQAYREIRPEADEASIQKLVIERYQTVAREELDGALAIAGRIDELNVDLTPVRDALAQRDPGRGLVVTMSHHDSFFIAMLALARCGVRAHLMISDVVFDERVHPTLRAFTRAKYNTYVRLMNGGLFLPASAATRNFFHDELRSGHVLLVVTDTPAEKQANKGTWVSWLGKRRKIADGALRMAIETDSQMMAMRVRHELPGVQKWSASVLVDPRDFGSLMPDAQRESVYGPLVLFMEEAIRVDTGRWSAAHLLGDFECCET